MNLAIALTSEKSVPLYRQLYGEIRQAVLSGRLAPGQRLPSTRALAEQFNISRATVNAAFAQLLSEGYVESRTGAGTFVCREIPDELFRPISITNAPPRALPQPRLSAYGRALLDAQALEPRIPPDCINFRDGRPAFDAFDIGVWRRLISRHCRRGAEVQDYSADAAGFSPLREEIAKYLRRARAVRCTAEQVVIVSGSQQAIDLSARLLLERGDAVAVEDPGYPGARRIFQARGAVLRPVDVDANGMRVDDFMGDTSVPRLVYVTPSHQFPTGSVLSLPRRLALSRWARETGTIVLEDDYDSAFQYDERPIPSLQGLEPSSSVIYIGTFSKVLFPALRLGYVVVPDSLVDAFANAKSYADRQSPLLEQRALADFLSEGHFERHLRRMRALYAERRAALEEALRRYIDGVEIYGARAGMHLMARFPTHLPNHEIVERAQRRGVWITSDEAYACDGRAGGRFVLGYAELTREVIERGIRIVAETLALP